MKINIFLLLLVLFYSSVSVAQSKKELFADGNGTLTKSILESKSIRTTLYRANDELALPENNHTKNLDVKKTLLGYQIIKIDPKEYNKRLSHLSIPYMRVFYTSRLKNERSRYISTGNIIVELDSFVSVSEFAKERNLVLLRTISSTNGVYLFSPEITGEIIEMSNKLNTLKEVKQATPEWIKPVLLR